MRRPAGVTAAAVVCILGSALALLMALMVFVLPSVEPRPPELDEVRGFVYVFGAFIGMLAIFGIATGIGLLKLRPWARNSILVFAGIVGAFSLAGVVTAAFVPAAFQAPAGMPDVRAVLLIVYGLPLVVSIWWLVQFNHHAAKQAFAGDDAPGAPRRPLTISIIGWFNIVGGVGSLLAAAIGADAFIAGARISDWGASSYYVFVGAVNTFLGWRLLQLDERARVLTIWWFVVNILHTGYVALNPTVRASVLEMQRAIMRENDVRPAGDPAEFTVGMMVFTALMLAAAIWPLISTRSAFRVPEEG